MIFSTVKLRGSSLRPFLSVMQITMMKIARYESCENTRFSCTVFRRFSFPSYFEGGCSFFPIGTNAVYGGRYLLNLSIMHKINCRAHYNMRIKQKATTINCLVNSAESENSNFFQDFVADSR